MTVRLRNLTAQTQTITIVRPTSTYSKTALALQFIFLTDDEYGYINPPLVAGIWEVDFDPTDLVPTPPPPAPPPPITATTTDDLPEGATNLYFTDTRARNAAVQNSLSDGNTSFAPSQDVVFDALALKVTNGANVGTGTGNVFKAKSGVNLEFRRLLAGTGITITQVSDDVQIETSGAFGEANTASNSASGVGTGLIFKNKVGVDLVFKKLLAGSNITITNGTDDVTIAATVPTASAATPTSVGAANITGTGSPYSREDHAHQGVHSVAKSGDTALYGDVTFSAGSNITLTQVGQDIQITAAGGASTLDDAYGFGSTITTNGGDGDVTIAGTEAFVVTADTGVSIQNNTPSDFPIEILQLDLTNTNPAATLSHANSAAPTLRMIGATSGTFDIQVPAAITSYSVVMPAAQGAASTYLCNDGSGNLTWGSIATLSEIDTTLSPAQILALHTTPITLVPAPGAGLFIDIDSFEVFLDFNTTAYAGGSDVFIDYATNATNNITIEQSLMTAVAAARRFGKPEWTIPESVSTPINEAVRIFSTSAFTTGNSNLKVRIRYRVLTALT